MDSTRAGSSVPRTARRPRPDTPHTGCEAAIVLTATVDNSKGWMTDQNEIPDLSTNSLHRLEPGATHAAFVDDPAHAAAVTRAIHDVVVSLRTGASLGVLTHKPPSDHQCLARLV